ncbi:rRNA small subunit 7-methylguanosine (m7G) methyltransferase GidB [Desulfurella amilsii]|uniref:Ribosomal RNA small subunit methyltransferase G n=1 Tax=Desulfurella amilsii TaxID=1562698 RepID=A0A1X4XXS1_9BACT|nr:16S rRNA (guanine(527)-N(7))-methyltransferase RsmG [Desulfurella amilsii]OSS42326.1 rRNA small subunit 7-methylguanosine (m7G) methyltransferase GidB [Desulfurella amilsii]
MYNQNQLEYLLKNENLIETETVEKIKAYIANLEKWNNAINLTSKNFDYFTHIRDSLMFFELFKSPKGKLLDIGSGNGFPVIILAIVCPKLEITMVESSTKKCAFLRDTISKLSLNANVLNKNIMDIQPKNNFDFATIRGLKCSYEMEIKLNFILADNYGKLFVWAYPPPSLKRFTLLHSVCKNNKYLHLYIKAQAAPQPI